MHSIIISEINMLILQKKKKRERDIKNGLRTHITLEMKVKCFCIVCIQYRHHAAGVVRVVW